MGVVVGLLACAAPAWSADEPIRIRAVLIWGTNDPKPDDPKLKALEDKTRKKLRAVFKWKDYYEVNRKVFAAAKADSKRVRLSDSCEITARDLGGSTVKFTLYGEGKHVVNKSQSMDPGELLVLAGEAENNTAWFVALTRAAPDEKDR